MGQFGKSLRIPVGSDAAPIEVPTRHRGIHPGTTHGVWVPPVDVRSATGLQEQNVRSNTTPTQHLLPEKMHKWNLRLDVSSDPLTLIAALEEKMTTYRINPEEIPGLCPKSLRARRHGGNHYYYRYISFERNTVKCISKFRARGGNANR